MKGKSKKLSGTDSEQEVGYGFIIWIEHKMFRWVFPENGRGWVGAWSERI